MYLLAQNRVQKYSGAVAARPRAGFGRVISRGGPNLVLTRVVTAPNDPPRYMIVIVPLQSTKPLILYIDGINRSKPYIVIDKRYIVPFAFKANRGDRSYQICIDKLKQVYSLFLRYSVILLSGFRLSIRLIVFIANVIKLNTKFIQIALKVTIVKVAKLVILNK